MASFLTNPALILGIIGGLAVIIFFIGVGRVVGGRGKVVEERLEVYAAGGRRAEKPSKETKRKAKEVSPLAAGLEKRIAGRGFAENMARDLARANLKFTVAEFLILNLTIVLLFGLVGFLWTREVFGFGLGIVGLFLPRLFLRRRGNGRVKAFDGQLGDTITLLANALRSGYSLLQAMETVSRELALPISEEFERVVREIGLGLSAQDALANLLRRIDSDDLDLIITAINVQHEVGGNLAEILDTIAHTIRERVRIKGEINIFTAQGRMTGYVLSFLPIGLGVLLYIMNPDYMGQLFADQCGWIMVTAGALSMAAGFIVIQKIVDIDV